MANSSDLLPAARLPARSFVHRPFVREDSANGRVVCIFSPGSRREMHCVVSAPAPLVGVHCTVD